MTPHRLLLVSFTFASTGFAATVASFNGGADTPVALQAFGDINFPPNIQPAGGFSGGYLQVTSPNNSEHNWATFDRTDVGTYPSANFSFRFKLQAGATPTADGMSFSFASTTNYGTSGGIGGAPFTAEDPNAAGILGFGFDTWSNHGGVELNSPDDPAQPQGSNYEEISVFYNGALVNRINDTRVLATPLTLDDGLWHAVTGTVNFAGGTISLSVDGNSIHNGLAVPGLVPFESRIMFAGRTGGENEDAGIDDLNVTWVPEPGAAALGLVGFLTFLRRRRA